MHALFCTFFRFRQCKIIEISKIWQSCSHVYTATFYEPQRKCSFWFFLVRCAHKSDDVINFTIVVCRISSELKPYKNCKNRLRLAKVIVKNKMSRFLWFSVYKRLHVDSDDSDFTTLHCWPVLREQSRGSSFTSTGLHTHTQTQTSN